MSPTSASYEDRLGVLEGELDRLVRRLRGLSTGAWRARADPVQDGLSELVAIEAMTTEESRPRLSPLPEYALADAAAVLGADALAALSAHRNATCLTAALSVIRSMLDATR